MADLFDQAQDRIEIDLAQALRVQKERASTSALVVAEGFCKNPRCGEEFEGDKVRLFCNPNCSKEFERLSR